MLQNTFLHIPGIGESIERRLWASRILSWDDFLASTEAADILGRRYRLARWYVKCSRYNLHDIHFFKPLLPGIQSWRLFHQFHSQAAYLDIETTGMYGAADDITVIGLYDGKKLQTFIWGKNLGDFIQAVKAYPLLITFNGSCFDLPFIESYFKGFRFNCAHIDLRFLLKKLGYGGGLKRVEEQFGLRRDADLANLSGYDAVLLWQRYRRGDRAALDKLIRYNTEDVVNLQTLMWEGYALLCKMMSSYMQ